MVRQAYCIVVTVAKNDQAVAFRVIPGSEALFTVIKKDPQARIRETAIRADALLPDSGSQMELWQAGEQARPIKYLVDAFASDVRLPKLLNRQAILNTLLDGCEQGIFVFRTRRPEGTYRTFWRERPGEVALNDESLEVVLSEYATLTSFSPLLLQPGKLPALWQGEAITLREVYDYFSGRVVQVQMEGYSEPIFIPKAEHAAVNTAVQSAVRERHLWLLAGRASLFAEDVPDELLTDEARLQLPPTPINAGEIIPENLPEAWSSEVTTAHDIAEALSAKTGTILPWFTVRGTIETAFTSRWLERTLDSGPWPCDYAGARAVKIRKMQDKPIHAETPHQGDYAGHAQKIVVQESPRPHTLSAEATLAMEEMQDLNDQLVALKKATVGLKLTYTVHIELEGSATQQVPEGTRAQVNALLAEVSEKLKLQ